MPKISPLTYPVPPALTDTLDTFPAAFMVTVADATSPLPVILYKGTLLKVPGEYPAPTILADNVLTVPPLFSIIPPGNGKSVPKLTLTPIPNALSSALPVVIASTGTLTFLGNTEIEFGNNLCVCAFLFPSFGL